MERLTLKELKTKLDKLTLPRIQKETEKIITKDPSLINRKQWEFLHGEDPFGNDIGVYANEDYRLFKIQLNPLAGGKVDLILTGATKNALRIVPIGNREFYLESTDWKWDNLVDKYGERIRVISYDFFIKLQREIYAQKLIERMQQIIK